MTLDPALDHDPSLRLFARLELTRGRLRAALSHAIASHAALVAARVESTRIADAANRVRRLMERIHDTRIAM
jgi:hypothetical protein